MINPSAKIEDAYSALINGIREFMSPTGTSKVILGLSGGIDSAVVAALATKALGNENVHAFLMPSEFSTLHSVQDAVDLAENLNIKYNVIPISSIYNRFTRELIPVFGVDNKWNVAEENLQARIRGTLLMAYSNKFNALVLNTTNKSELCCGYGTLYGDLVGAAMVLADLYKCEVYELAEYINSNDNVIPYSTMTKAPSAELRQGQKDSDSLPDYSILDPLLYALIEGGKSREDVIKEGFDTNIVDRVITLMSLSKFKMCQLPPIFNISKKPMGYEQKWAL